MERSPTPSRKQKQSGKDVAGKAIKIVLGMTKSRRSSQSVSPERSASEERTEMEGSTRKTHSSQQSKPSVSFEHEEPSQTLRSDMMTSPFEQSVFNPFPDISSDECRGSDDQLHKRNLMTNRNITFRRNDPRRHTAPYRQEILSSGEDSDHHFPPHEQTVIEKYRDNSQELKRAEYERDDEASCTFASASGGILSAQDPSTGGVEGQQLSTQMTVPPIDTPRMPKRLLATIASKSAVAVEEKLPSRSRDKKPFDEHSFRIDEITAHKETKLAQLQARREAMEDKRQRDKREFDDIMERSQRTLDEVERLKERYPDIVTPIPRTGRQQTQDNGGELTRGDRKPRDDDIYMTPVITRPAKVPMEPSYRQQKESREDDSSGSASEYIPQAQPGKRTPKQNVRHQQPVQFTSTPFEPTTNDQYKHSEKRERLVEISQGYQPRDDRRQPMARYENARPTQQDVRPKQRYRLEDLQQDKQVEPPRQRQQVTTSRPSRSRKVSARYPPLPGLSDDRERQPRKRDDSPDLFSSDEEIVPREWIPEQEMKHESRYDEERHSKKTGSKRQSKVRTSEGRKRHSEESSDSDKGFQRKLRDWKKRKPSRKKRNEQRIVLHGFADHTDSEEEPENLSTSQVTTNIVTVSGKLPNISKFSNSPQDTMNFSQFLDDFELHSSAMMIPRSTWGRMIPLFLVDGARVIYKNLLEKYPSISDDYTKLAEKLSKEMQSQGGRSSAAALYNRKKLPSESVGRFYADISSIARRVYPNMESEARDDLIMSSFISGLPQSYRRGLMNNQAIRSSEDAFKLASRFEQTNDILLNDEVNGGEPSKTVNAIELNQDANMEFIRESLKNLEMREGKRMNKDDRDSRHRWREQNMKRPPLGGNAQYYDSPKFRDKRWNNSQPRGSNKQQWEEQNRNWSQNDNKWQNRNSHNRNQQQSRQLEIEPPSYNNNNNQSGRNDRFRHAQNYQQNHEGQQEFSPDGRIICGYCQKKGHPRVACRSRLRDQEQDNYHDRNRTVRMVVDDRTDSVPIVVQPESEAESLQRLADQIEKDDKQSGLIKVIDNYAKQHSPNLATHPEVLVVTSKPRTNPVTQTTKSTCGTWREKYPTNRPVKYVKCEGLEPTERVGMIQEEQLVEAQVPVESGTRPRRRRQRQSSQTDDPSDRRGRGNPRHARQTSEEVERHRPRSERQHENTAYFRWISRNEEMHNSTDPNDQEPVTSRQRQTRDTTVRTLQQHRSLRGMSQIENVKHIDVRRLLVRFPGTPPKFDDSQDLSMIPLFRIMYKHNSFFRQMCNNWMHEVTTSGRHDPSLLRNSVGEFSDPTPIFRQEARQLEGRMLAALAEFKAVDDFDRQIERTSYILGKQFHETFNAHSWLLAASSKYLEYCERYNFRSGDIEGAHKLTCHMGLRRSATSNAHGHIRLTHPFLTEAMDRYPGTGPLFRDAQTQQHSCIYRSMYKKDIRFRLCCDQWTKLMVLISDLDMQYNHGRGAEDVWYTVIERDDHMRSDEAELEQTDERQQMRPPAYESLQLIESDTQEESVANEDAGNVEEEITLRQTPEEVNECTIPLRETTSDVRYDRNSEEQDSITVPDESETNARERVPSRTVGRLTKRHSFGLTIIFAAIVLMVCLPRARGEATKPMLCNVGNNERNHLHLLLHLPEEIKCAQPKNFSHDITPLSLQLYKTSTLVLQEKAHLCTKQTTKISTFLYFFTEERLVDTTSSYKGTSYEECRAMINKRQVYGETLTDVDGVISTHKSLEPVYTWCCKWIVTEIVNYILTKGYVYLHRDTGKLQSTLADLNGCSFQNFHCTIPDSGLIIWEGKISEECIFQESLNIPGQNHVSYWLSDDRDMSLSFERSQWQATQVCPKSKPDLWLIKSDQGIYVKNTSEIYNLKTSRFGHNLTVGSNIGDISQFIVGEINSVATALSIQIQNLTRLRFWDSMNALCKHEKVSMQLISRLMLLDPTTAVRYLLNDPYTISKPLSGSDIAVYSCYALEDDQYSISIDQSDRETKCGDWIPVKLTTGIKAGKQMFMSPVDNILHTDIPHRICKGNEQTYFRLNKTLMFYEWGTNKVRKSVNQGNDMLKQLLFHNISYNDTTFKAYTERIALLPISDLDSGSDLLTDFVQTMQRERKQLRNIGIFPNSGKENTDQIPFKTSGMNLFEWISSGMDKFFKIWSIVCNVIVTMLVLRGTLSCANRLYVYRGTMTSNTNSPTAPPTREMASLVNDTNCITSDEDHNQTNWKSDGTTTKSPYKQPLVEIEVNGIPQLALIDTGSSIHLANKKTALKLGLQSENPTLRASAFGGTAISLIGSAKTTIKIGNKKFNTGIHLTESPNYDYLLLGFPALSHFDEFLFCIPRGIVVVDDFPLELCAVKVTDHRINQTLLIEQSKTTLTSETTTKKESAMRKALDQLMNGSSNMNGKELATELPSSKCKTIAIDELISFLGIPWKSLNEVEQQAIRKLFTENVISKLQETISKAYQIHMDIKASNDDVKPIPTGNCETEADTQGKCSLVSGKESNSKVGDVLSNNDTHKEVDAKTVSTVDKDLQGKGNVSIQDGKRLSDTPARSGRYALRRRPERKVKQGFVYFDSN